MKVLILSDYFHPHLGGGVEKMILELSIKLVNSGYEVCVLTLNTTDSIKKENFHGIQIIRVKAYDLTKITGLQSAISFNLWFEAKKLINDFQPDIIHLHNRFFFTTFIGILLRKKFHLPTLVTLHLGKIDYIHGIKGYIIRKFEKFMIRLINNNSTLVTAVSHNVKDNGVSLGIKNKKCIVIPNGVDLSFFKMMRTFRAKPRKIIFIGRLLANKGPQILVKSANIVRKKIPDVQFFIVGDGPLREKIEKYCDKNHLSKNIQFLGRLDDIRDKMKESDLYVRPSYLDGMPLGVLEAMAAELPVLATNIAGTKEIVQHGKTGYLVKADDEKELAEAIIELLMNPETMEKIAKNGLEFVKTKYDWKNIVTEYAKCYQEVLSTNSKKN